jgi:CheY-like chemotaxis protein
LTIATGFSIHSGGGAVVAKILVADDNSNIQRMVGLALKDQGIEVVAVGNGEAAVKKIVEIRPDLVLADVFMPVRNGYEVCQFVKEDPSFSHIPVILLIGAFDPLDEQEAQRVGADGVLKKPFVPPDPLITMVKAALKKAGVSLSKGVSDKINSGATRKATDVPVPPAPNRPLPSPASPLAGLTFSRLPSPPASIQPIVSDESFVDTPARPQPVKIDAAEHMMAFGNLMETTVTTEDPGFATLKTDTESDVEETEPLDVPEEDEESTVTAKASWRDNDQVDGEPVDALLGEDGIGPLHDWRDSDVAQNIGRKSARETWEHADQAEGFASAEDVPTEMVSFATELSALEGEALVADKPEGNKSESGWADVPAVEDVESTPEPSAVAVEVPKSEEAVPAQTDQHSENKTAESVSEEVVGSGAPDEKTEQPASGFEYLAAKPDESSKENSWFSRPASPWGQDAQAPSPATEMWSTAKTEGEAAPTGIDESQPSTLDDAPVSTSEDAAPALPGEATPGVFDRVSQASEASQAESEQAPPVSEETSGSTAAPEQVDTPQTVVEHDLPTPAEETLGASTGETTKASEETPQHAAEEEVRHATGEETQDRHNVSSETSSEQIAAAPSDESAMHEIAASETDAASSDMEALVARVLARISPEMLQAVTKQILKPVVAAILEDEAKRKK